MKIVDLGEYSMVIEGDPEESLYYRKIKFIYSFTKKFNRPILVCKGNQLTLHYLESSDCLCSGEILLLYFIDKVPSTFQIGDEVYVSIAAHEQNNN